MLLIISQNPTLIKTGIENIDEPEWFNLKGEIVNPGLRYTESDRQCPGHKGSEFKRKIHLDPKIKIDPSHGRNRKLHNAITKKL